MEGVVGEYRLSDSLIRVSLLTYKHVIPFNGCGSLFRRFVIPKVRYSEHTNLYMWRFVNPKMK